jgi:epsilon-lactone hydrolase
MTSIRGRLCRIFNKVLVAPKLSPNLSVAKARRGMEAVAGFARPPSNTRVEKAALDGMAAEWVCRNAPHEDRAILYLHGGGYSICSPRTHRELAAYISGFSGAGVLVPDYRLAPEHPFPCALEDARAAYRWLLEKGLRPDRIAIAGDSAGGGLSLATALSLRDAGEPPPASIACISPWTDLALTGESLTTRAARDPILNLPSLKRSAAGYVGSADPRSPGISPLYADLSGLPPLLVHVGSDEMLYDDSIRLVKKAENDHVDATLQVYDRLWHVFHLYARIMPEARNALADFGSFMARHWVN